MVGDLTRPAGEGRWPGVLVLHGFGGHRGERHVRAVAQAIAEVGCAVLRVDLPNNRGEADGQFADLRVSEEVEDAAEALRFLAAQPSVDAGRLGVTGHSLGGLVAALLASRQADLGAVVTLSAVYDMPRLWRRRWLDTAAETRWRQQGFILVDGQPDRRLDWGFWADLTDIDVDQALARLRQPLLVVHGSADEAVPVHHARRLHDAAASTVKHLLLVDGADHLYSAGVALARVCEATAGWFARHLAAESG